MHSFIIQLHHLEDPFTLIPLDEIMISPQDMPQLTASLEAGESWTFTGVKLVANIDEGMCNNLQTSGLVSQ